MTALGGFALSCLIFGLLAGNFMSYKRHVITSSEFADRSIPLVIVLIAFWIIFFAYGGTT